MSLSNHLGVGVDIESISRFVKVNQTKDHLFLDKIYTDEELNYCFSKKNPAQHLAARFAGKEAVIKALNCMEYPFSDFKKIEISNNEEGVPKVRINQPDFKKINLKISLSHCEDKAIAFVVAEKNAKR